MIDRRAYFDLRRAVSPDLCPFSPIPPGWADRTSVGQRRSVNLAGGAMGRRRVLGRSGEILYWPCFTPGSPSANWMGYMGFPPGVFASRRYLPKGRTTRPKTLASIIALPV